jgi:two-component system response regulator MprA
MKDALALLIVDDNARMRSTIRSILADRGYAVTESVDGLDAVESCERTRPDWVLMDISMPRLDGISAARRIRVVHPTAKVVMVTDYDDDALWRQSFDAGAVAWVNKHDLLQLLDILPLTN